MLCCGCIALSRRENDNLVSTIALWFWLVFVLEELSSTFQQCLQILLK